MPCCAAPIRHWATVVINFARSGQLIDLAAALVIGNAFTKLVESLVDNLVTPIIGFLFNGIAIGDLQTSLSSDRWAHKPPVNLPYGKFLQQLIYFTTIAIILSVSVIIINRVRAARQKNRTNPEETPTKQELILMEHTQLLQTIAESLKK